MASFTIDINTSDLTTKLSPDKLTQAKAKGLEYSSQELIRVLMRNSPVDHGLLKSWFLDSLSSDEAVIKSPAEYAEWVNDGTRPYTITPISKKALYWEGADHPVHEVNHPGNKAYKYMEEALMANIDNIVEFVMEAIGDIFD